MLDPGSYLLGALELTAAALSLGLTAHRLRARLLPTWQGAPAVLIEAITSIALLIWISEALGTFQLLYAGALVAASLALAALALWLTPARAATHGPEDPDAPPAGGGGAGVPRGAEEPKAPSTVGDAAPTGPAGRSARSRGSAGLNAWSLAVMWGVIAIVVFHWATTAYRAWNHGIFNFDSLWYHLPFAAHIAQTHAVTGMDHVETVFTNWFYPQNSELIHAAGILLTGRDTLSPFVNFGWLAVALLAAWCIGRPYRRGSLAVVAAAIVLDCHTLVVREPGAAKNDLMAAALILAAIAILVEAWNRQRPQAGVAEVSCAIRDEALPRLEPGWPLAVAGLAVGLAAGTKYTALAMPAALSVAVLALAPAGRRWAAAGWWFVPALLGGGYWYLRNLVVAGNPVPEIHHLGPISLPHPLRLQEGRPNFSIVHYATDTGVWRHYFAPDLHQAFGSLWPLVILGAAAATLLALLRGRDRIVRWIGGVALFGLLAYLFTPLSAAGAEGAPVGFGINIRYVIPALLAAIVLLPLPRFFDRESRRRWLLGALVVVFLLTDRPDAAVHDKGRLFALLLVALLVAVPAALLYARSRGASAAALLSGCGALALAVLVLGYPAQRHYLRERFRNQVADESVPGMHLDAAYRWARGVEDARIGLAGTSAGFAGYGFYGTDLSNRVIYLGEPGPHGAYNAIPTCAGFRAAVNAADLDYLVTAPFLNFIHPSQPIASPEARWLRGERAVEPVLREGPVTVWKVTGRLDPSACGPANAPLREIPMTPAR